MRTTIASLWIVAVALAGLAAPTMLHAQAAGPLLGAADYKVTPEHPVGWRGDGSGRYPGATPPLKWSRTCPAGKPESAGILWMTPIPRGASSPIVVGDRIFVGFDPYGLLCLSKTDGRVLWYRTHHYFEVMPEAQRKAIDEKAQGPYAQLKAAYDAEIKRMSDAVSTAGLPDDKRFMEGAWNQQVGEPTKQLDAAVAEVDATRYKMTRDAFEWASATPVSDGKFVYMWYSHHVAVCYDLEGKRQWATVEPAKLGAGNEHGRHSSPILAGDKFVAEFGTDLLAFDRKTGKLAWTKTMTNTAPWVTPAMSSLAVANIAGQPYIVPCRGEGFRASDGELGWKQYKDFAGGNATPVVEQNQIYMCDHESVYQLLIPAVPGPSAQVAVGKRLKIDKIYAIPSPLVTGGLVYTIDTGAILHVFDPATGTEAYTKQLPLDGHVEYVFYPGCSASPTLAGKYIYITDNQGATLILEPGPQYKEVGLNRLDVLEKKGKSKDGKETAINDQTISNPVFDGKQMFIRAQRYLYCVGAR
jgi:outer membrane protein assembly factor BamB